MKIDSHQHFWQFDPNLYPWITEEMSYLRKDFLPGDFSTHLQVNGFEGCMAIQAAQNERDTQFLLDLASRFDFIKGVVGWADPCSKQMERTIARLADNPVLKGFRHTVWDQKGEFLLTPEFFKFLICLQQFHLTFDLLVFDYQLESAVKLTRKFSEQAFVLDHCGNPNISGEMDRSWRKNLEHLSKNRNVYCKISGLLERLQDLPLSNLWPYLDVVTHAFTPERLMFGSNWPVSLGGSTYRDILHIIQSYFANFSESEREMIFGGTAGKFYKIES